jgi:diadenosine tetraphosphate (Ap4A) HIT family hydrolase
MDHCEFCQEFGGHSPRFENLYGRLARTRIVARTDRFVALPTLGQLFTGSLLLLPVSHLETCAHLATDARQELAKFAAEMASLVRDFGEPILFEHGATEPTGGGCGIYHAHLHIVPVPRPTLATALFPEYQSEAGDLLEAWTALERASEYLLMSASGRTLYSDLGVQSHRYPSQFFRRRIAEYFRLEAPWDWRAYADVEPAVLRTLALGQSKYA